MKNEIHFIIPPFQKEMTLKEFLKSFHVGRGKIEEIRVINQIKINNIFSSLDSIVHQGDEISILSIEKEEEIFLKGIEVLYEDDGLIAVNKKEGILVHSDGKERDNLVSRLANYRKDKNEAPIVIPLHRLDKDTSGVILFAKDFFHGAMLDDLFAKQEVKRTYVCICEGKINIDKGELRFNIGKNRHDPNKMIIVNNGQEIITQYQVMKKTNEFSYLSINIKTGKRHQIRVTLAHINHPIVGDKLYGSKYINSPLLLQATSIEFIHPLTHKRIIINSPLKKEIKNFSI